MLEEPLREQLEATPADNQGEVAQLNWCYGLNIYAKQFSEFVESSPPKIIYDLL